MRNRPSKWFSRWYVKGWHWRRLPGWGKRNGVTNKHVYCNDRVENHLYWILSVRNFSIFKEISTKGVRYIWFVIWISRDFRVNYPLGNLMMLRFGLFWFLSFWKLSFSSMINDLSISSNFSIYARFNLDELVFHTSLKIDVLLLNN